MEGRRISHWVIESRLGEGGMGEVWKARHETLKRHYAIKVMSQRLMPDPQFEARFIQEAGAQARLQHPHIVGVSDFFLDNGIYYLVMPYIEGQSLEERMAASRGPLPLTETLRIARDVLLALDYAHQQAVIHRDVKPSNILLDRSGHAYLVDFGIALTIGQERKTRTGAPLGTAHYMSPEQIVRPKEIDHRTDVYSFGCVLYEMLTGKPPFDASAEEGDTDFVIKDQHVNKAPLPPRLLNPNLRPEIEAMVTRALAKHPNERFSGCGEFARALAQLEKGFLSLVYCPHCGNQNQVSNPETLARERCGRCGKPFVQETPGPSQVRVASTSSTTGGTGWKPATIVVSLLALFLFIGLIAASSESTKTRKALQEEKATRTKIAEKWPLIITGVKLRNEDKNGNPLGGFSTTFSSSAVRYVSWYATMQNSSEGIKPLSGKLGIKYIRPDGSLRRSPNSPEGFTQVKDIFLSGSGEEGSGWGSDTGGVYEIGTHRIEFWWESKKVGETSFFVSYW